MKVPVAVKPTVPCGLLEAVADEGATVMLVSLACPAPQPNSPAARNRREPQRSGSRGFLIIIACAMGFF